MTILNFPSSPSNGQTYAAPNGVNYTFDGVKWISNAVAYGNANVATYLPTDATITSIRSNIIAGNAFVISSNSSMKNYVDSQIIAASGYGNTQVVSFLASSAFNGNIKANVVTGNSFVWANGTSILYGIGGTYSNANVSAFLSNTVNTTTFGNIVTTNGVYWANGAPYSSGSGTGNYGNANVAVYLPTYSGNISTNTITTTNGLFWGNGTVYAPQLSVYQVNAVLNPSVYFGKTTATTANTLIN